MEVKGVFQKSSDTTSHPVILKSVSSYSAFESRFRKVMCDPTKQNIPLDLPNEKIEAIYNGITPVIETSIFAEMEHVMIAIRTSLDAVIDRKGENMQLKSYMSNDKTFKRFITHVATNYQSLQEQRINILMVHNKEYQRLEDNLFGETFVDENGFRQAYQLHNELILAFHDCYHDLLFEGTMLNTDEKIEVKVIVPNVQKLDKDIKGMLEGDEDE